MRLSTGERREAESVGARSRRKFVSPVLVRHDGGLRRLTAQDSPVVSGGAPPVVYSPPAVGGGPSVAGLAE